MKRIDIVGELLYRINSTGLKSFISVAPECTVGAFAVIRQDDPEDIKTRDALIATRCDVLIIVSGNAHAQVVGGMNKVLGLFESLDTEIDGTGFRTRCKSPGKVEADGVGDFWQEVLVKVRVMY
jgi:hypothetical protein